MIPLTFIAFGQSSTNFIEKFKPKSLPTCVSYSYEEQVYFGAIYHTETIKGEAQDIFKKNKNYQKDSSLLLTIEFVKQHLLPNTKYICTIDDKNKDTLDKELIEDYLNSDFYSISSLLTTSSFHMVLYERIFSISGIPSSEKFICTFTKNGEFVSRSLISSFAFNGTGLSISGARVPWFPVENGCINNDMTIKFTSRIHGDKKYKIETDGKIIETK